LQAEQADSASQIQVMLDFLERSTRGIVR